MARKKKTDESAAPQTGRLPAKSEAIRKYHDTVDIQRPLEPADYENIQKAMVARNRQKLDLIAELGGHNAKIREARRQIAALADKVEADLLTIESGTMTEERPCLCLKDSNEGTIIKLDPESGEIYQTETLPRYQRDFIFTQTADEDCHSCKYLVCLKAALGENCESYLDCHDCPGFSCAFEFAGTRCGFGKHDHDAHWRQFPAPDDLARDCFFCRRHNCE